MVESFPSEKSSGRDLVDGFAGEKQPGFDIAAEHAARLERALGPLGTTMIDHSEGEVIPVAADMPAASRYGQDHDGYWMQLTM